MTARTEQDLDRELEVILGSRALVSSAGFPYFHPSVWARFRDWVPHILADGPLVLDSVERVAADLGSENATIAARVVRQIVTTAAITAPPDLWILRQIVAALHTVGLARRFLDGECVRPTETDLRPEELLVDLRFLLSRGTLVRHGDGFRLGEHAAAGHVMAADWTSDDREPGFWHPTGIEVEQGYRLVPTILARREDPELFRACGLLDAGGSLNAIGRRVLERGIGPFGIIEAYRGYLAELPKIWREGRGSVWVERRANVQASQVANAGTFRKANDSLDRFCAETGFEYRVFIEHALGRGEATRQRYARRGDRDLRFVGADLEEAAIDAAVEERDAGRLPADMLLVRRADIGRPEVLLQPMRQAGIDPVGAVMVVGNGFHEVRDQTDSSMTAVFRGYREAGLVLVFTEETGLAIDDLLETAWNTYHAGFKYVHERSGQGLRPAVPRPPSPIDGPLPASWAECAERAGYVRPERYCSRSRTVYPYTPPSGHNPSISVTHFCVPADLAARLGLQP